jgi:CheY-like chemotaxis protein
MPTQELSNDMISGFEGSKLLPPGEGGGSKGIAVIQALPDPVKKAATPRRVLVVEDNLDSAHMLVLLLRKMGHTVEYAINGYAALQVAEHFRPDFVLLDLGLPGINGFEVCERLKAKPSLANTRVIAVTAYTHEEHRLRSKKVGCELHLVKPLNPRVLEEVLNS